MRNAHANTIIVMGKNNAIILYVLVLACVFFGFEPKWAYTADSAWWTHLTFHFTHGNIFHLAANMLVVFLLLFYRKDGWWMWILCYLIAILCSFVVCSTKPTVGLSGLLLAYYGIICYKDGARWKSMLQTLAYMVVSCIFASRLAIGLHFMCFALGAAIGGVMLWIRNIKRKEQMYG